MSTQTQVIPMKKPGLLEIMSSRYGLAPDVFERTVAAVAMPQKNGGPDCSREELISCLVVANEHDLNPLTKEIYFMRTRAGVIQPIVSVDGWIKKLNQHPQFDGLEFEDHLDDKGEMTACTVVIHRKDRAKPTRITEYMAECAGDTQPWKKTRKRMLRHRTLTQGARYAVGFAGVMDHDEFDQWQKMRDVTPSATVPEIPELAPPIPEIPAIPDIDQTPKLDAKAYLAQLEDALSVAKGQPELIAEIAEEHEAHVADLDEDTQAKAEALIKAAE